MPNTKHKANSPTVIEIHEEWAIKNGYAQARKPTSVQALKLYVKIKFDIPLLIWDKMILRSVPRKH